MCKEIFLVESGRQLNVTYRTALTYRVQVPCNRATIFMSQKRFKKRRKKRENIPPPLWILQARHRQFLLILQLALRLSGSGWRGGGLLFKIAAILLVL
jgi:hypothetical protein